MDEGLSRRTFLQRTAALAGHVALAPFVVTLSGCGGDRKSQSGTLGADAVWLGLYARDVVVLVRPGLAYSPRTADRFNQVMVSDLVPATTGIPWDPPDVAAYTSIDPTRFESGIAADRVLSRAYALSGGMPSAIHVRRTGTRLDPGLEAALRAYSGGILRLD